MEGPSLICRDCGTVDTSHDPLGLLSIDEDLLPSGFGGGRIGIGTQNGGYSVLEDEHIDVQVFDCWDSKTGKEYQEAIFILA